MCRRRGSSLPLSSIPPPSHQTVHATPSADITPTCVGVALVYLQEPSPPSHPAGWVEPSLGRLTLAAPTAAWGEDWLLQRFYTKSSAVVAPLHRSPTGLHSSRLGRCQQPGSMALREKRKEGQGERQLDLNRDTQTDAARFGERRRQCDQEEGQRRRSIQPRAAAAPYVCSGLYAQLIHHQIVPCCSTWRLLSNLTAPCDPARFARRKVP